MRLLRIILTGLFAAIALLAGLFIAAIGLIALAVGRLFGRPGGIRVTGPVRAGGGGPAHHRPAPAGRGDVIDVTATEVPVDSVPR